MKIARTLAVIADAALLAACDTANVALNRDLSFSDTGDGEETLRASVASDTRVIATARKVGSPPT